MDEVLAPKFQEERRALREALGRVGVWSFTLEAQTAVEEADAAREIESLGYGTIWVPEAVLAVEQTVVLETDPPTARRIARRFAADYLQTPNYANNLRRMGYTDQDLSGQGSDRVIDATIAWGDADRIAARVRQHLEAGADHVCVQVAGEDDLDVCLPELRELAPALLG